VRRAGMVHRCRRSHHDGCALQTHPYTEEEPMTTSTPERFLLTLAALEEASPACSVCRGCGACHPEAEWKELLLVRTCPATKVQTSVATWPESRRIEARECAGCGVIISQVVDESMPAVARFTCWFCDRECSEEAWRDLPLVCTVPAAAVRAHVVRWTRGGRIEARQCSFCGRSISRIIGDGIMS
jgi:hypothetical protein